MLKSSAHVHSRDAGEKPARISARHGLSGIRCIFHRADDFLPDPTDPDPSKSCFVHPIIQALCLCPLWCSLAYGFGGTPEVSHRTLGRLLTANAVVNKDEAM